MTNVEFESIDDYRDIETLNFYKEMVIEKKEEQKRIMKIIHKRGRDNARTPMQWNSRRNAGFTSGTPWLKVNPNCNCINVEDDMKNENSILNYYTFLPVIVNKITLIFKTNKYNIVYT